MNVVVGSRLDTTTGAVATSPSPSSTPDDRATLDDDAGHLGVAPQLATVLLEQPGQVVGDGAQTTAHL